MWSGGSYYFKSALQGCVARIFLKLQFLDLEGALYCQEAQLPAQRVAKLISIQIENHFPKLQSIFYINTRWLSLGNSLDKLLGIWNSLQICMQYKANNGKTKQKKECKKFLLFLSDKCFKLKIICLAAIVERLNRTSQRYHIYY